MVWVSALVTIYYNVIIAWIIYYFFSSMAAELPWAKCGHDWNSERCREYGKFAFIDSELQKYVEYSLLLD